MSETVITEADRLDRLEEELARLRGERDAELEVKKKAEARWSSPEVPEPTPESFAGRNLARQRREREERARIDAEWSAAYERQLATPRRRLSSSKRSSRTCAASRPSWSGGTPPRSRRLKRRLGRPSGGLMI